MSEAKLTSISISKHFNCNIGSTLYFSPLCLFLPSSLPTNFTIQTDIKWSC